MRRFFPREYVDTIHSIDFGDLWRRGFRGLIIDIDNTLETFDIPLPSQPVINLLQTLKNQGFSIVLFSNNSRERVSKFCENLDIPGIWRARKPGKKGIRRALIRLNLPADKAVLIGDQIFTDCWGGNRMGIYTILTRPIAKRDEWTVRLKRLPEKLVLYMYERGQKRGNIR